MKRIVALSLACLLALGVSIGPTQDKDKKKEDTPKKRVPKFTVGKETTYVTGPIDKDGYLDCVTALNERLGQGVTPQNNANVLLWQAFGPHPDGSNVPLEFFKWMKIDAPPEKGDYFIPLLRFAKDTLQLEPAKITALEDGLYDNPRPWQAQDRPHLAAWLKANEKPLALVTAATGRMQYYYPLVVERTNGKSGSLFAALIPGVQSCRHLATALTARAMLRAGEGKFDDAWQDLLTTHRLGRLVSRGGTLIEGLVGIAVDSIAAGADVAFLDAAKPDAKKAKSCLHDLRALPGMSPMADKINLTERFMFLDTVMQLDYHGVGYLDVLGGGKGSDNPALKIAFRDVHWDTALRNGNDMFSRLSAAMRLKVRPMREKELYAIELEIKTRKAKLTSAEEFVRTLLTAKNVGDAKGKYLGEILITLLVPAVVKVQHAADRNEQTHQNLYVAIALAAYQSDEGRYPNSLDALAPKYLEAVPHDLFTGKALIYRPSDTGYLFYSVGINGEDEGGRSYYDDPRGDDLPVRMPLPKKK